VLEREARTAIEAGDLPEDTDPADVAFQLNALAAAASYGFQLWRDREVFARARRSMGSVLGPRYESSDGPGRPARGAGSR
jgi:hypothetical protein